MRKEWKYKPAFTFPLYPQSVNGEWRGYDIAYGNRYSELTLGDEWVKVVGDNPEALVKELEKAVMKLLMNRTVEEVRRIGLEVALGASGEASVRLTQAITMNDLKSAAKIVEMVQLAKEEEEWTDQNSH